MCAVGACVGVDCGCWRDCEVVPVVVDIVAVWRNIEREEG